MAKFYKILHWNDDSECNHEGKLTLNPDVLERDAEIQNTFRIVTADDLLNHVHIKGCKNKPTPCTKVTEIVTGRAKDLLLMGQIPLLGNLVAKTDQEACIVRWKKSLFAHLANEEVSVKKKVNPGFDDVAYYDNADPPRLTVGYGHNADASPVPGVTGAGSKIDLQTASDLFDSDQQIAENNARSVMNNWQGTANNPLIKNPLTFDDLTGEQQQAMTDLAFNMGGGAAGLAGFHKFLTDMRNGDFDEAAKELGRGKTPGTKSDYIKKVGKDRSDNVKRELHGSDGDTEAFAEPE